VEEDTKDDEKDEDDLFCDPDDDSITFIQEAMTSNLYDKTGIPGS